jgi:hypothetical protein
MPQQTSKAVAINGTGSVFNLGIIRSILDRSEDER